MRIKNQVLPNVIIIIIVYIICILSLVELVDGTNIKWIANTKRGSNTAAEDAPKSQRYWDKNNIERPDYAKTDAEIAFERGISTKSYFPSWLIVFIISGIVGIVAAKYVQSNATNANDYTTGTSMRGYNLLNRNRNASTVVDAEKIRLARLQHFSQQQHDVKSD